ncbi:hypothetical protein F383_07552 [Gossypium arboreum]|uniref:Uncharacterized protein n=1 Tax=Gossypium arboreum TaxID=29729 RepID=A0A0B0P2X5_GOSAR|nr:hypothetical protein F383_07552 [Gossypium arboreum]
MALDTPVCLDRVKKGHNTDLSTWPQDPPVCSAVVYCL